MGEGYIATQCRYPGTEERGSFLYRGTLPDDAEALSPNFPDLVGLYAWLKAEGWKATSDCSFETPYLNANPEG